MMYSIGDKVFVLTKIVQKIENEEGVSYDVTLENSQRFLNTLRVKDKDIIVNRG